MIPSAVLRNAQKTNGENVMAHRARARWQAIARTLTGGMVCVTLIGAGARASASDSFRPLHLYEGAWNVIPDGKSKPDRLVNDCAAIGRFFACQQTVNGTPGALVLFIPSSRGRYHTQVVMADGAALGPPGTLMIAGDHWVYLSGPDSKGIRYRTTNQFHGRDRIRFTVEHSSAGKKWIVTLSGVEERSQPSHRFTATAHPG